MKAKSTTRAKPQQIEYRIHTAIVDHLEDCFPQIEFTHAGKARDETHAHFLSEMGYEAGTGDLLWCCSSKWGDMEIKAPDGVQSPDQITRQRHIEENGGYYTIVRSVREAHEYFVRLGIKPRHNAIVEPDLRSDEQKKKDVFDLYKP